jgi:cytoskeletal protein RodZ
MISNTDLQKWQDAVNGINTTGKTDLTQKEWSALIVLNNCLQNSNFQSKDCYLNLKILKDNLSRHSNNLLLMGHLINFIALLEQYIVPEVSNKKKVKKSKSVLKWFLIPIIIIVIGVGGYFLWVSVISDNFKCKYLKIGCDSLIQSNSGEGYPITPDGITLNKTSLEFKYTGSSEQLTANVFPPDMSEGNKRIIWRSSDERVAAVDENGVVTTYGTGSAVISAYTGNGLSATCYVTVGEVSDAIEARETITEQSTKEETPKVEKSTSTPQTKTSDTKSQTQEKQKTTTPDIITLQDGTDIKALVQEEKGDVVKYKKFDNQDGPNYSVKVSDIFMIKYAKRKKKVF